MLLRDNRHDTLTSETDLCAPRKLATASHYTGTLDSPNGALHVARALVSGDWLNPGYINAANGCIARLETFLVGVDVPEPLRNCQSISDIDENPLELNSRSLPKRS